MKFSLVILACLVLCGCSDSETTENVFDRINREHQEEQQRLFVAWQKIYCRTNLTFQEWQDLRDQNLLPGQPPKDSGSDFATGVLVGHLLTPRR